MARALSLAARQAIMAQETGEVFLVLVKIDHDALAQPLYFVRNAESVVSGGIVYIPLPFDISLPSDTDDEPPQVTITFDNVDRSIMEALRQITTTPDIYISVVLASSPDTLELGPLPFQISDFSIDATTVTGTLIYDPITAEQYPCDTYTPGDFPSLFGGESSAS